MTALSVSDVKKSFVYRRGTVVAVDGASFDVNECEIFGLLGMNGAGKSTLIKICTGLLTPDGGSVSVYGNDIVGEREKAKSLVNVSPQETAVAPLLSVGENLRFIAEVYGADSATARAAADEMAEKLGLKDRMNDRAGKLSGGLMRRLSVGMALITSPKLVFLDEPTLGLDVVARRELWRYIRDIRKTTAVVLTTHYLEEAEALCDRIAVMAHGKIAAVGTAEELKQQSGESTFENAFLRLSGEGGLLDE
ncbi:MAG: ABC transporter ATP-binding protein [Clostridiales bacterium]|nr:ABC transporter ATP-binding protein [Clostridiales bacterium]